MVEKWKLLAFAPILIGIARVIHFSFTGYFLPDEATYLACVIHYFNDGNFIFYGPRQLFQFMILGISIIFNLTTVERLVPLFVMVSSILTSLTIFLSVKITQKEVPNFTEKWIVPLLFLLSPMFCVVSGLILTEIYGIFFAVLAIFIFVCRKDTVLMSLVGILCGLCYHLREPLFIVFVYIVLHSLYYKQFKNIFVFFIGFIPFLNTMIFRIITQILTSVEPAPTWCILSTIILRMIGGRIGDIYRPAGFTWKVVPSTLLNFINTSILDFGVMLVFSLGIFSAILIIYGLYKKKTHHLILLSFVPLIVSLIYLCRYDVYRTMFFTKISTVTRYGVMSVFCIPFIPSVISNWEKKRIKQYFVLAIVCTALLAVPFTVFVQSNLSGENVNRLDIFNYKSPWLIQQKIIETKNETDVLIICEPGTRSRFYQIENITYGRAMEWHWKCVDTGIEQALLEDPDFVYTEFTDEEIIHIFTELTSQYAHIYFYGEKYSLYDYVLESQVSWYWKILQDNAIYEIIHENKEMYLYEVTLG